MKFGVIGGGAWGTALAQVLAADRYEVVLWAFEHDVVESINARRVNERFLPGVPLSPNIRATGLKGDLWSCEALLVVTPAQHLRGVLAETPVQSKPLILCAKGIEAQSRGLMHEVAADVHHAAPVAVLSGPTFAREVALGLPTAITLACADVALGKTLAQAIGRPAFRPYLSTDVVGAEIGGAVKNVLAIACGVVAGRGLGENARAAVIARGFAEMTRFGIARGGRAETLAGLSGLGDLVLTCSSTQSRNFTLGVGLGQGARARNLLADRASVAEGAFTAPVLAEAARAVNVSMPVVAAVCALLNGAVDIDSVIDGLLARPIRDEG